MAEQDNWQQLLEGLRQGDSELGRQIWERYRPELLRRVQNRWAPWLRQREDPEDVVQSIFRTFFRYLQEGHGQFTGDEDLLHLLGRIALLKVFEKVRYHEAECRNVRNEVHTPADSTGTGVSPLDLLAAGPSPEDAVEADEVVAEFRKALESLEGKQRQVVEQTLQERSTVEIAESLGISDSMVRRYLRRAKDQLKRQLRGE